MRYSGGRSLLIRQCALAFFLLLPVAAHAVVPESAATTAQGTTGRGQQVQTVQLPASSHEIRAVVITPNGPSASAQATISEEPAVIIKLKEMPLGPFKRRLERGDPNRIARIRGHADKLLRDHNQIKAFIRSVEPGHNGRFRDFHFALNGLATRVKAETVEQLRRHPLVQRVYNDVGVRTLLEPNVTLTGAPTMWSVYGATGKGVRVAVVDTGIDYTHPDLGGGFGPGYKVIGGYDFVNNDADPMDDHGHGTHVAGIVAANGTLKGVAPDAQLLAYKVLDQNGSGSFSTVIAGINLAMDPDQNPLTDDAVDIITMSLGGPGDPDDAVSQAVDNAVNAGVVCTIAAGNSGSAYWTILSPGAARGAITVGASDLNDAIASFSSRGPVQQGYAIKPDVTAPGVSINSTYLNHGYAVLSGTSMATPHVAGAAALLLQLHPTWTPAQVKGALIEHAMDLGQDSFTQGGGRIQPVQSHLAQAVLVPSSLSFGLDDVALSAWSQSESVGITNLTAAEQTYSFSIASTAQAGITYEVTPSSVTLAPNETQSMTVTVTVDNALVPNPLNEPRAYGGRLVAASSMDTLTVPFAFLKSSVLNLTFDAEPWMVLIHDRNNDPTDGYGQGFYVYPGTALSTLVPPRSYDILAVFPTDPTGAYNAETRVVKEDVVVETVATVAINRSDAVNHIVLNQVDADQRPLSWDGLNADGPIGMRYFGRKNAPGLLSFGMMWRDLYFSNLSDAYTYDLKLQAISAQTNGAYYEFAYGLPDGVTQSQTLTNSTAFKHVTERYAVDPAIDRIWITDFLASHGPTWRFGTTAYYAYLTAHVLSAPFTREAYYPALPYPGFYVNQTFQDIYQYVGPVFGDGDDPFIAETANLGVSDPTTADLYQLFALDSPFLSITGEARPVNLGPPLWSAQLMNGETTIELSPVWGDAPSFYLSQTGDSDARYNSDLSYELYHGASLIQGETFPAGFYENITLSSAGVYTLKIPHHGAYWIHGQATDTLVTLTFDTRLPDKNPPSLKTFRLLTGGEITDTITASHTPGRIMITVQDDIRLAGVAAYYGVGGAWQPLSLPPVISGATYTAVVDLPSALFSGLVDLKLVASDASGNTMTYEMTPAFYQIAAAIGSAPEVVTGQATDVTKSAATLNGAVNTNGVAGTAWFEWGRTAAYGRTTTPQSLSVSTVANLTASLSKLKKNVTYHYRMVAQNSGGMTHGVDRTFTPRKKKKSK